MTAVPRIELKVTSCPALFGSQELAGDNRAAGGQRGKNIQDQVVDHIHQRNTGNGGFAYAGYHHGIGHAHQHVQRLLHHQRPQ